MKTFFLQFFSRLGTFLIILFLAFFLLHIAPGSPFDSERKLPADIEANLYQKYGLEKKENLPFHKWLQHNTLAYINNLKNLSLGPSLKYVDRDVSDIIKESLPVSFTLGGIALLLAILMSLTFAIFYIRFKKPFLEKFYTILSSFTISAPVFIIAIFLIYTFSLKNNFFPSALWESTLHKVLPIFCLSLIPFFYLSELLITEMQKQQKLLYVTTAKSKGLGATQILLKHVLKNSLTSMITVLGPITASLLTGSFVVETIFSIPGLGKHFVHGIVDRDYFLVMGITIVYAATLLLMNWLADSTNKILDPRNQ